MEISALFSLMLMVGALLSRSKALECFCDSAKCRFNETVTCKAGFACYTEIRESFTSHGCLKRPGITAVCIKQGRAASEIRGKPYLLLCCFEDLCNVPDEYKGMLHSPSPIQDKKGVRAQIEPTSGLSPLQMVSVKVLSIVAAAGLFMLMLIVACGVHLLCNSNGKSIVKSVLRQNSALITLKPSSQV
ncbi:BMP and activin membrane-bound inhibitor homolog [Nematostella vectensis]|uniref:BMP and activin membrane-bound inhibitor homolog n=1 Tax=Nematostella vectensis TaxID=45351 RepID=UPI002076E5B9|nr:BMP and activin membrane-bound inhibitor homolog [Nematostella vectensis]